MSGSPDPLSADPLGADFQADPGFYSTQQGNVFDYEAPLDQYLATRAERAYDNLTVMGVFHEADSFAADMKVITGEEELIRADDARREVSEAGVKLTIPDHGIPKSELKALIYLKQREQRQDITLARRQGLVTSMLGLGTDFVVGALDPINVATSFIPVVPEARYLAWLERAGASAFARAGVRAGVGALEGGVGAILTEPLNIIGQQGYQREYGLTDSFLSVMFGTALGAGLHTLGGAVHDKFYSPWRDLAAKAPDETHREALLRAENAFERDKAVDADVAFQQHYQKNYAITEDDFARATHDFPQRELDDARAAVVFARGGDAKTKEPGTIIQAIVALGGIKVRDAEGNLTREGTEIMAVLGGRNRYPGLINNKRGMTPDYLREALVEDGWLVEKGGAGEAQSTLQDLYDIIEGAARGERVSRGGESRGKQLMAEASRELAEAGVTAKDSITQAAIKVAEHRRAQLPDRIENDPDFTPNELFFRDMAEQNTDDLSGPISEETRQRYEPTDSWEVESAKTAVEAEKAVARADRNDPAAEIKEEDEAVDVEVEALRAQGLWDEVDDEAVAAAEEPAEYKEAADLYRAAAKCMVN